MNVGIVGGGLTGMTAAYELAKQGHTCTIYERDAEIGGLAGSFSINGAQLEKFYHHLFTSDTAMAGLIEELGLGADLEWKPTITSYYANRIYRLASPLDVLAAWRLLRMPSRRCLNCATTFFTYIASFKRPSILNDVTPVSIRASRSCSRLRSLRDR